MVYLPLRYPADPLKMDFSGNDWQVILFSYNIPFFFRFDQQKQRLSSRSLPEQPEWTR